MESITLNAENGYIKFHLTEIFGYPDRTSHFGGYDVIGQIEIKSSNYFVKGGLNFTTGEIYDFYTQINKVFKSLDGLAKYDSSEFQLSFLVKVDQLGHISIVGEYLEDLANDSKLIFELKGDQSYLDSWLYELNKIVSKYGDNSGIKK